MNETHTLVSSALLPALTMMFVCGPTSPIQQAMAVGPKVVRSQVAKSRLLRYMPFPVWGIAGAALCCELAGLAAPSWIAGGIALALGVIDLGWLTVAIAKMQEEKTAELASQALQRCRALDAAALPPGRQS